MQANLELFEDTITKELIELWNYNTSGGKETSSICPKSVLFVENADLFILLSLFY